MVITFWKMTFQAAVGIVLGLSDASCDAQSMVWPRRDLAHRNGNLIVFDGVVRKKRQRELTALTGPQDAGRPAGGHGQHLGVLRVVVGIVRRAEKDAGVGRLDVQERSDDVVATRVRVIDDDGSGPARAHILRHTEVHVECRPGWRPRPETASAPLSSRSLAAP